MWMQQALFFAERLNWLVCILCISPEQEKHEKVKKLLLHSKELKEKLRQKCRFWSSKLSNIEIKGLSLLGLWLCPWPAVDALSRILTQNQQNCSIPAKGFIQIIMPFDLFYSEPCFSPVTLLRLQETHVRNKAVLLQYSIYQTQLPPAAVSEVIWRAPCQRPQGRSCVMSILVYPCSSWPCWEFSSLS